MSQSALLLLCVGVALLCTSQVSGSTFKDRLSSHFTTSTTTPAPTTTSRSHIYINNNIPKTEANCMVNFVCKKRLVKAAAPKPCVKYCVKNIECPNAAKIKGAADQCVELDETQVALLHESDVSKGEYTGVSRVAMIDFPCQPGFLPDYKGRCREVW